MPFELQETQGGARKSSYQETPTIHLEVGLTSGNFTNTSQLATRTKIARTSSVGLGILVSPLYEISISNEEPQVVPDMTGKKIDFLIDTGHTYTLLISHVGHFSSKSCTVTGVNGKPCTHYIIGRLTCQFEQCLISHVFLVVPQCPTSLLERAFLRSLGAILQLWGSKQPLILMLTKRDWTEEQGPIPSLILQGVQFSSIQFSRSDVSYSLCPHELQHARLPCPLPTPGVHPDSCPSRQWCHPAISSSVVPFSSCPQSLPSSESFSISQLFAWGGQTTGVSALASFLPKNTQDWSPLERTGWISLQFKRLSRVFSNTTVQRHQFFGPQLSSQSNSHIHTWPLEKP